MALNRKVYNYLIENLQTKNGLLFVLIDPLDHKDLDSCTKIAKIVSENGADAILIGGSIGVQGKLLDDVVKNIKNVVNVPVILFPGNIGTISQYADAIYFMSMLNSRSVYWITNAQMQASLYIKSLKVEPLAVAYCVVEPGGTVGYVGDANLIPRNKPQIALSYAVMSEFLGFKFFLTDSGSNAPSPVSEEFVSIVSREINIPYIVGGGIKTPEQAFSLVKAGADILQIGTAFENLDDVQKIKDRVIQFSKSIKEAGKAKKDKEFRL